MEERSNKRRGDDNDQSGRWRNPSRREKRGGRRWGVEMKDEDKGEANGRGRGRGRGEDSRRKSGRERRGAERRIAGEGTKAVDQGRREPRSRASEKRERERGRGRGRRSEEGGRAVREAKSHGWAIQAARPRPRMKEEKRRIFFPPALAPGEAETLVDSAMGSGLGWGEGRARGTLRWVFFAKCRLRIMS